MTPSKAETFYARQIHTAIQTACQPSDLNRTVITTFKSANTKKKKKRYTY
ncbi:hypothetical protein QJS04_geneDACA004796 [Acorus gramineus]|uniref:Uncharacterized protein n=1 Tax=Acorus gramineus TaxID=55184 RepID=A0AAV9BYI3_ACOGR|nr:hypothetical protein QJS04_geneDACA004796 [Acorus gramineus]